MTGFPTLHLGVSAPASIFPRQPSCIDGQGVKREGCDRHLLITGLVPACEDVGILSRILRAHGYMKQKPEPGGHWPFGEPAGMVGQTIPLCRVERLSHDRFARIEPLPLCQSKLTPAIHALQGEQKRASGFQHPSQLRHVEALVFQVHVWKDGYRQNKVKSAILMLKRFPVRISLEVASQVSPTPFHSGSINISAMEFNPRMAVQVSGQPPRPAAEVKADRAIKRPSGPVEK